MKKIVLIIIVIILMLLWTATMLHAQQQEKHYGGLLLNDSVYNQIPKKPVLLTRSYDLLPKSYSLRSYCPAVKNQGSHCTCTSWASAYAARTITEAIANHWNNPDQITGEAFSPLFVYSLVKGRDYGDCQAGIYIDAAFEELKRNGVVKYKDFNYDCTSGMTIPSDLYSKAESYTIDDYFALFSMKDSFAKKISTTKKSISESRPVIISMKNYNSFQKNDEEVWSGIKDSQDGYHAMCVVGYDDDKYGGAFLLMNSWGPRWGDGGFKWVKYTDYGENVNYAMEMYVRKKEMINSSVQPESVDLAGTLNFVLSTGQKMRPKLYGVNDIPYYVMEDSYVSGTRYRLYLSNREPAYVYVICSDLGNAVAKVFPPDAHTSPALVYASNDVAIPDEKWYIELDNTTGKDYVCVLYSRDELPIDNIIVKIKAVSGSFFEKVNKALADQIIPAKAINYNTSSIKFSAENTNKTVVPVIVEIDHK